MRAPWSRGLLEERLAGFTFCHIQRCFAVCVLHVLLGTGLEKQVHTLGFAVACGEVERPPTITVRCVLSAPLFRSIARISVSPSEAAHIKGVGPWPSSLRTSRPCEAAMIAMADGSSMYTGNFKRCHGWPRCLRSSRSRRLGLGANGH